jgi:uncharacterized protein YqgV (UPF0045/DUF77 family)
MPALKTRVLTDHIGPFNTVVLESETADLMELEKALQEYMSNQALRDQMKGYTELYLEGGREVYKVV